MPLCLSCGKKATFGYKESRAIATACKQHKQAGMRDVKHPPCQHCDRRPSFAAHAGLPASHCKLHKTDTMVNVKHAMCTVCIAQATLRNN